MSPAPLHSITNTVSTCISFLRNECCTCKPVSKWRWWRWFIFTRDHSRTRIIIIVIIILVSMWMSISVLIPTAQWRRLSRDCCSCSCSCSSNPSSIATLGLITPKNRGASSLMKPQQCRREERKPSYENSRPHMQRDVWEEEEKTNCNHCCFTVQAGMQ